MSCYIIEADGFRAVENKMFMCGDMDDPHCFACNGVGDFLCDFPVGKEKTCDRPMCSKHRNSIAPEIDYCEHHKAEYDEFRKNGGLTKVLRYNVVPFASKADSKRYQKVQDKPK